MNVSVCVIVLGIALIFVGCAHQPPSLVERLDSLDGLTESQVMETFGAPNGSDDYAMSEAVGEFRTSLQKYHPMPESRDVQIRELTWDVSEHFVTAWLHQTNGQWLVFDSVKYDKGVMF